jgi:hypothetical protein
MADFNPFFALVPKTAGAPGQMGQQTATQAETMPFTIIGTIIGVATTFLTLALLNRPAIKTWFANQQE